MFTGLFAQRTLKTAATVFALLSLLGGPVQAAQRVKPKKPAPLPSTINSFVVNPTSLRQRLLEGNTSVLQSLNNVYQSRELLNIARGNILPSLSATALLNPAGFASSSLTFLFPFLLPSNWFNLDAQKHQLTADGIAYYLVELNEYSIAYAIYMTILEDEDLRNVYQQQVDNYAKIEFVIQHGLPLGLYTQTDLDQAAGATKTSITARSPPSRYATRSCMGRRGSSRSATS